MRKDERDFLTNRPVAHLATADNDGVPHVIPVCFVLTKNTIFITIDRKPKKGGRRSYLESNPSLVFKTEELRSRGYKHKEISKALFDMGFVNGKGNEFAPTQISRILKQAKKVKTA